MPELSPAAQEVFWAFNKAASGKPYDWHYLPAIAAALQAVADQVVPEEIWLGAKETCYAYYLQRCNTRQKLLAIAAELKAK